MNVGAANSRPPNNLSANYWNFQRKYDRLRRWDFVKQNPRAVNNRPYIFQCNSSPYRNWQKKNRRVCTLLLCLQLFPEPGKLGFKFDAEGGAFSGGGDDPFHKAGGQPRGIVNALACQKTAGKNRCEQVACSVKMLGDSLCPVGKCLFLSGNTVKSGTVIVPQKACDDHAFHSQFHKGRR